MKASALRFARATSRAKAGKSHGAPALLGLRAPSLHVARSYSRLFGHLGHARRRPVAAGQPAAASLRRSSAAPPRAASRRAAEGANATTSRAASLLHGREEKKE